MLIHLTRPVYDPADLISPGERTTIGMFHAWFNPVRDCVNLPSALNVDMFILPRETKRI